MARRVESVSIQVEQNPTQTRRVKSVAVMVEQKSDTTKRRVESIGLMVEQKRSPHFRQLSAIAMMVEWEPNPNRYISGTAYGTSDAFGTLLAKSNIYELNAGEATCHLNLSGNANIYGINTREAVIDGIIYGEAIFSGIINNSFLVYSFLWNLAKNNEMAIGLTNVSGELKLFLNLNGNTFVGTDLPGVLIGIGTVIGLINGKIMVNMDISGQAPANDVPSGQSLFTGLVLAFVNNRTELTVQSSPFEY